uniref:Uncharacterized protein n=1 Tax=Aegilops tauschii subsp. strangulata TaxID=200361 RepID=A0A452XHB3_AEGTS
KAGHSQPRKKDDGDTHRYAVRGTSRMGLLDQLWDDTVAGPRPDHGFSKLRKYSSSP